MNDLISRDKLRKEILDKFPQGSARGVFLAFVDEQPTVEPVRGEWIPDERGTHFCSVCDSEAYWDTDYGQELFDWCPYCGADMRGEKND